jgi:hypothetical protein
MDDRGQGGCEPSGGATGMGVGHGVMVTVGYNPRIHGAW